MKWIDAILKVLSEEGQAMHYQDIANKIVDHQFRENVGATPASTVNSVISQNISELSEDSWFIRVNMGEYFLNPKRHLITTTLLQDLPNLESPEQELEILEETTEEISKGLIKSFGMFWSRHEVFWKNNPSLYGAEQKGADKVDFASQVGIYMLHDGREVLYIGQAMDQSIVQRLYQHTSDRLGGRWDRFSWFGFKGVMPDGSLLPIAIDQTISYYELADTLEAIMVEGLEPRQNRKRGNKFSGKEFIQEKDSALLRKDMLNLLEQMKNQLEVN